jgi:hypothetical protein
MLKPAAERAIVAGEPLLPRLSCSVVREGNGRETRQMRIVTIATVMLALIAVPAHSQMGGKRNKGDDSKADQSTKKVDEKAYKAALERIPEPKEKYDPWGIARPADPAKKPK